MRRLLSTLAAALILTACGGAPPADTAVVTTGQLPDHPEHLCASGPGLFGGPTHPQRLRCVREHCLERLEHASQGALEARCRATVGRDPRYDLLDCGLEACERWLPRHPEAAWELIEPGPASATNPRVIGAALGEGTFLRVLRAGPEAACEQIATTALELANFHYLAQALPWDEATVEAGIALWEHAAARCDLRAAIQTRKLLHTAEPVLSDDR
jgi:hypothetical protein